jgi:hypothetical protein
LALENAWLVSDPSDRSAPSDRSDYEYENEHDYDHDDDHDYDQDQDRDCDIDCEQDWAGGFVLGAWVGHTRIRQWEEIQRCVIVLRRYLYCASG